VRGGGSERRERRRRKERICQWRLSRSIVGSINYSIELFYRAIL
jgi:hypothetical protein